MPRWRPTASPRSPSSPSAPTPTRCKALLAGEADANDTYIEINAGAGGTESQDWAEMLQRMYTRWAERHGMKVELVDYHAGEQAGIKSATLLVKGENAYGYAKTESGVHRLVRISPYDSAARRHTSFSSVWVYPVIDDDIDVEINESDLRIDTYRASGAGGQHINTTNSAVRITHMPTGIVVQCQNQRSQHKNKAEAYNQLRARLYERELAEREAAANAENATKTDIGWGHQIRSYVLQPYQLVKDLRTGVTSTAPSDVLDGALDSVHGRRAVAARDRRDGRGGGCRLMPPLRLADAARCCSPLARRARSAGCTRPARGAVSTGSTQAGPFPPPTARSRTIVSARWSNEEARDRRERGRRR